MTQLTNDYIYEIIGNQQIPYGEDIVIGAGAGLTAQNGYPVKGQSHRVIKNGTASAALVMKSILSLDNPQLVIIINDDPTNAVNVFPFKAFGVGATDTTETINGGSAGFAIAAVTAAVFWSSVVQTKRKGSGTTNTLNWSAATFS